MIKISNKISIDESELQIDFVHASGPGGQNVNKVTTAVQLRFDVLGSSSLPEEAKTRLKKLAGKRMTREGVLVIEAKRYRTQEANRKDALARFIKLTQKALIRPKKRKHTKPTKESQEKRLKSKKQKSVIKQSRKKIQAID